MIWTRRRLLVFAATAVALLALPGTAQAKSLKVVDANVHLRLAPDASLLVREDLTFEYEDTYEASYRDIFLRHGEKITDVQVSEDGQPLQPGGNTAFGSHDRPGVFGATSIAGGVRIVWHLDATDERRTWTITYRVIDAAVAYDDVIELDNWQVWGDQWDFELPKLHADFTDPALDPANNLYRVWGHPLGVAGQTSRDQGVANLSATDVPDRQFVDMRVTIPRTAGQNVSGARVMKGEGLPKILAEEQEGEDDFNSPWHRFKRFIGDHGLVIAWGLLAIMALALIAFRFLAREHSNSVPEHLPEPPDDATPALAYGLAHEGEDSNNTVLATLLDLVERKFYDTKTANTEDEKLDVAITKASKRPSAEKLTPYEKETLGFFDELIGSDTVPLSEMKDRIPEHDSGWRSKWEGMTESLNDADEGQLKWDRNLNGLWWLIGLGMLVAFAIVLLVYRAEEGGWFPPALFAIAAVVLFLIGTGNGLKRLAPDYRERSTKWQSFEKWTEDFPRLEDDPPATLELWKRILIFGVAFGTADRMIKSGRIPEPVKEASAGSWSGYYFSGNYVGSSFDGNSFSSGFSSQVAPESSSSGGGGGFSGGGGGGSGGGGGGGW